MEERRKRIFGPAHPSTLRAEAFHSDLLRQISGRYGGEDDDEDEDEDYYDGGEDVDAVFAEAVAAAESGV